MFMKKRVFQKLMWNDPQNTIDAKDTEISVADARPMEKSPDPETQNKNGGYKKLVLKFKTGKDAER